MHITRTVVVTALAACALVSTANAASPKSEPEKFFHVSPYLGPAKSPFNSHTTQAKPQLNKSTRTNQQVNPQNAPGGGSTNPKAAPKSNAPADKPKSESIKPFKLPPPAAPIKGSLNSHTTQAKPQLNKSTRTNQQVNPQNAPGGGSTNPKAAPKSNAPTDQPKRKPLNFFHAYPHHEATKGPPNSHTTQAKPQLNKSTRTNQQVNPQNAPGGGSTNPKAALKSNAPADKPKSEPIKFFHVSPSLNPQKNV